MKTPDLRQRALLGRDRTIPAACAGAGLSAGAGLQQRPGIGCGFSVDAPLPDPRHLPPLFFLLPYQFLSSSLEFQATWSGLTEVLPPRDSGVVGRAGGVCSQRSRSGSTEVRRGEGEKQGAQR